jgi:alkylation response protein AidB-like acyl-CoA dehydrogenase
MAHKLNLPTTREGKRLALLDAVERVRETLTAGAAESEERGTLDQVSVDALYQAGLFSFTTASELGGEEVDPLLELEVTEAACRIDPSAGWCMLIAAGSVANIGAFLPDEAIDEVFPGRRVPKAASVFAPTGIATPVDGGYRLNGRWSFASGIRHSEWVTTGAWVAGGEQSRRRQIRLVVPVSQVKIHDNWQVMGLRGTGSCDFSVKDLFVPDRFAWDVALTEPLRGGAMYRLGRPGFVTNEHSAFALGVGRRSLDAVTEVAASKSRGYNSTSVLARRPAFQRTLSECDLRLRAARALNVEVLEEAWETVCNGRTPGPALQAQMRSVCTYTTDVAADVVSQAFRYGGGAALFSSSVLQRCLRDINAGAQHQMVSDTAYENHGQFLLGLPDARPME